ncbi:MAG: carboxypeptidase-like regulatory domain-containing protein [Candidatus Altiarchaeota archaeon]|nr:carboxypeptidase-like regulatory domain-containing protein [Candidatus Altiarchaeota archaeon]
MKKLVVLCFLVLLFSSHAYARYITDIETDPDEIDPGDSFAVIVELKSTNWAKTVNFYMDGVLFDSRNLGSDEKKAESIEWDTGDKETECGPHQLTIQITRRTGDLVENETMEIDVGNVPSLEFYPDKPNPDKPITLKFKDKKTGAGITNADIKITKLRDIEDIEYTGSTNAQGEMSFTTSKLGEYRMEMESREHCISRNFWVKKNMITDGPHPEKPVVGSLISFAVPSGVGVKAADHTGRIVKTASTSITGGVNFTLNQADNYTVIIGEISTEYWGKNVSFAVYDKLTPEIEVSPDKAVVNSPIRLHVSVPGQPLDPIGGLEVEVKKPTGEKSTYIADEDGFVEFTPLIVGEYIVKIEREDLRTVTKSINALNAFNVDLVGGEFMVNERIDVVVKDQGNVLVNDASITVNGTGVSGLTSSNGGFCFNITDKGGYLLSVTKEGFWPSQERFDVTGYLFINLSRDMIELGDGVEIHAYNVNGVEVDAGLTSVTPYKKTLGISENMYTPEEVGEYTIKASKSMYKDAQSKLVVYPHDIEISSNVSDNTLFIRIISQDMPVEGMSVLLETSEGAINLVTNSEGIAEHRFKEDGLVTVNANLVDGIREYRTRSVSFRIYKEYDYMILVGVIGMIVAITIASIILMNKSSQRIPKEKTKGKDALEREKTKSRLSKV